jgi:hypothetical protein
MELQCGTSSYWKVRTEPVSAFVYLLASLGDIEHMREALPGPGFELEAGQLYWLTDR